MPASASPALAKRTLFSTTDGNRIQNVESCVFLASFHQGGHKILCLWLFSFQKMTVVLLLSVLVLREIQPFSTTLLAKIVKIDKRAKPLSIFVRLKATFNVVIFAIFVVLQNFV